MIKIIYLAIQTYFSILSLIAPKYAGKKAFTLFQKPHIKKTRTRELELYEKLTEERIPAENEDLYVYTRGSVDAYPVVLVHGWDSNPGSMYGIAKELCKLDLFVIVLTLPAHGKSKLARTNMVHASQMIKTLLNHFKLTENFSFITHSFGSGASAFALMNEDIRPDKMIFMTSPDRIIDIFDDFKKMIHLGDKAYKYLLDYVMELTPIKMSDFNISEILQRVKYNELILIHDEFDKVLPWKNALSLKEKNPTIKLIKTQNKGHYRLLWDKETLAIIEEEMKIFSINHYR